MIPVDIPPQMEERVICSIVAAVKYDQAANVILAVAGQENGKPGQRVMNTNGTEDVGPMQFNTNYLKELSKYGITEEDVSKPGCYPYELAAWRIRGHVLNDQGDYWTRVANYHSRTPVYNERYKRLIQRRAVEWAKWLDVHFQTTTVSTQEAVKAGATQAGSVTLRLRSADSFAVNER